MNKKIRKLYQELKKKHGHPKGQWQLWCKRLKTWAQREEIIIGAILTQRTNWRNVELALHNLKKAGIFRLKDVLTLGKKNKSKLMDLIKPSGFYKQKTEYLLTVAKFFCKNFPKSKQAFKKPVLKLRDELLGLKGIGPETADSILLYALDEPVFVIDEYTRRLVKKYKISNDLSYYHLQKLFQKNLKKDFKLYQDFHALIVIEGKNV